ncbi:hypothetical protein D1007_23287 [Hordeum vulgare]|uniref:Predicted protein n=1 Tax=Hordeum vulgare subsp. vulgare TaxID=112509 RepID=F2D3W2_HORVV|nr:hypothetical protein D1007_23287 [Hordeum vulgare]BAJ89783.1 predicted protein [Hordeum vulgare subsp. vulgare]BAJ90397.1 predicted protein [Hordeum vulgare subsp. vulgare]BAJ95527.1 predicted protein [Hordeum vulgare subsp. vulgare]
MASTLAPPRWHHPPPPSTGTGPGRLLHLSRSAVPAGRGQLRRASTVSPRAFFGRADLDGLLQRAWRGANAGAERLSFEARQAAQRLDGRYSISRRVAEAARAARERAAEIDAELGVGRRWRSFSVDFSRSWPRYRRELSDFLATPIGRALSTLTFVWLALSGWLFRIFIFSTFVLPFAAPLLLGTFANRVAIEGSCPACKRRFVGYRNQVIRCMNCQNIVWQPNSRSSGGGGGSRSSASDVIDVEFEEK